MHNLGALHPKGRPTAIGGSDGIKANGTVEMLTEYGWLSLKSHPRWIKYIIILV